VADTILDTGIKQARNVGSFVFGAGSLRELPQYLESRREVGASMGGDRRVLFLVDDFFEDRYGTLDRLGATADDRIEFVGTEHEPTTDDIDCRVHNLRESRFRKPAVIVGVGGGITLDTAKAVSNLLTNGGQAHEYQGWDLVAIPGIHKVAVPTISGTGAEATRTCVMTNPKNGLKLGMNSDYTVFDHLLMDPELSATVPRDQYFYTGMDAYIHCMESLGGSYRNAVGDAYCRQTMELCRSVFLSHDMMSAESRERLMVASYLGGCAIATGYVGVVHPFSAGLSVVLGLHHCLANCITMRAMGEFYPEHRDEFESMVDRLEIQVPTGVARDLSEPQYRALYDATIIHEKPLTNALGPRFREVLTFPKVVSLFQQM
jgi:3-deoxy-alpha-D-manno-octulosonate 8-oxidase